MLEILANAQCNINIDPIVPATIRIFVDILKIFIPILLIIFGALDFAKAVMSNDEKEMKGAQGKLIKRCIYAVAVFFVVAIVQFLFSKLAEADNNDGSNIDGTNVSACIDCFINDENSCYNANSSSTDLDRGN